MEATETTKTTTTTEGLPTDEDLREALAEAAHRTLTFQQQADAIFARLDLRPDAAARTQRTAATLLHRARVNLVRVQAFLVHPEVPVSQLMLPSDDGDDEQEEDEEDEEEEEEEEENTVRFATSPKRVAEMWRRVLVDAETMVVRGYDWLFVEVAAFLRTRLGPEVRAQISRALAACVEEAAVAQHLRRAERHLSRVEALCARGRRPTGPAVTALAADVALLTQTYPHNPAVAAFLAHAHSAMPPATQQPVSSATKATTRTTMTATAARQAAQCRRCVERVLAASERARAALEARIAEEQQRTDADTARLLALPEFAHAAGSSE